MQKNEDENNVGPPIILLFIKMSILDPEKTLRPPGIPSFPPPLALISTSYCGRPKYSNETMQSWPGRILVPLSNSDPICEFFSATYLGVRWSGTISSEKLRRHTNHLPVSDIIRWRKWQWIGYINSTPRWPRSGQPQEHLASSSGVGVQASWKVLKWVEVYVRVVAASHQGVNRFRIVDASSYIRNNDFLIYKLVNSFDVPPINANGKGGTSKWMSSAYLILMVEREYRNDR